MHTHQARLPPPPLPVAWHNGVHQPRDLCKHSTLLPELVNGSLVPRRNRISSCAESIGDSSSNVYLIALSELALCLVAHNRRFFLPVKFCMRLQGRVIPKCLVVLLTIILAGWILSPTSTGLTGAVALTVASLIFRPDIAPSRLP